jgi:hypothetical protein
VKTAILVVAMSLSATFAMAEGAPQQTPGGAQRFFAALADSGRLLIRATDPKVPAVNVLYRVREVGSSPCAADLRVVPYGFLDVATGQWVYLWEKEWSERQFRQLESALGRREAGYRIEWGKVGTIVLSSAGAGDGTLMRQVEVTSVGTRITFVLPRDALARRTEYAANFLKAACDRKLETGF